MLSALHLRFGGDDAPSSILIRIEWLAVPALPVLRFSKTLPREKLSDPLFLAQDSGVFRDSRRFNNALAAVE